jgi:transcriptional regulator with XRE-family HTH domain
MLSDSFSTDLLCEIQKIQISKNLVLTIRIFEDKTHGILEKCKEIMQRCRKCLQVDGVIKAGFIRGNQRFFCKICNQHFVLENIASPRIKSNRQSTINDVANHLGISISTVSRALNDKYDVNPETKRAILQAAAELDYKPNFLAQSLHKGRTHTIGVIVPDVEYPFFLQRFWLELNKLPTILAIE